MVFLPMKIETKVKGPLCWCFGLLIRPLELGDPIWRLGNGLLLNVRSAGVSIKALLCFTVERKSGNGAF